MPDTVLRFLHLILIIILHGQCNYLPRFRDRGNRDTGKQFAQETRSYDCNIDRVTLNLHFSRIGGSGR